MPNSPLFAIPMLTGGSDYPTPDDTVDAKQINDQVKALEQYLGAKIVTSGTRPSSPKKQQLIIETDTGKMLYYSGTAWVFITRIDSGIPYSGTTAERDAFFGVPSTPAARVALANQMPRWLNTQTGYWEQYYAVDTDSGANQWSQSSASSWYPVGSGINSKPYAFYGKTIAQTTTAGDQIVTWAAASNSTDVFNMRSSSTRLTVPVRGRYRVEAKVRLGGSGGAQGCIGVIRRNGADVDITEWAGVGTSGAATTIRPGATLSLAAGDYLEVKINAVSAGSDISLNSYFEVEYLGAIPVSD